jgi:hypothetical protein
MKSVDKAFVFDLDGVITNLIKEKITQPEILNYLAKFLINNELIIFNTGRSIDWVNQEILIPLKNKAPIKKLIQNFFMVTEMGGLWYAFNQNGTLSEHIDKSLRMPIELDKQAGELIKNKYSKYMIREEKRTMVTSKILTGTKIEIYQKNQKELVKDLKKIIKKLNLTNDVTVGTSSIGTDIQSRLAGKGRAAKIILTWIKQNYFNPSKYFTFGDNFNSDIAMAKEIYSQGHQVEFVYVGKEKIDTSKYTFPTIITKEKYDKGTLEFLETL